MAIIKLAIRIVLIILILILIATPLADMRYQYFYKPNTSFHNSIINSIKYNTGDIILYTWRYDSLFNANKNHNDKFDLCRYIERVAPAIIISKTTHIAVIMCLNNIPYVYDLSGYGAYFYNKNIEKTMPRFCNFSKSLIDNGPSLLDINYLKYYGGHITILPYIGCGHNTSKILKVLKENSHIKRTGLNSVTKYITNNTRYSTKNTKYSKENMSCSAFIAKVLTELKIVSFEDYHCFTPQDVADKCIKSGKYDDNSTIFIDNDY